MQKKLTSTKNWRLQSQYKDPSFKIFEAFKCVTGNSDAKKSPRRPDLDEDSGFSSSAMLPAQRIPKDALPTSDS